MGIAFLAGDGTVACLDLSLQAIMPSFEQFEPPPFLALIMKPLFWSLGADCANEAWHQLKKFSPLALKTMYYGEVLGGPKIPIELAKASISRAFETLSQHGYKVTNQNRAHYASADLTVACGNIGIHTDDGFGRIALILLRVNPLSRSKVCQFMDSPYQTENYLWTRHGLSPMEEGDVVVFDTDQEHGWFCPGVATFLSLTVRKHKKAQIGGILPQVV